MISCIPASGEDFFNRQSLWKSILSSTLLSPHINLFHRSNSRGRFTTLSLTLGRRDISSLCARLNQYREQRRFRPSSPPDPDYDKRTHKRTRSAHKFLRWRIDLSLSDRVLGLRCWMRDTLAANSLLHNAKKMGAESADCSPFGTSVTLGPVSYNWGGDSLSATGSALCTPSLLRGRVWCLKAATRWHCGTHTDTKAHAHSAVYI